MRSIIRDMSEEEQQALYKGIMKLDQFLKEQLGEPGPITTTKRGDSMFKILSTASALPKCRKTNDDLSTFLDTSDEWISQRTGIRERAVCTDETLTDLLTQAADQALERAGITAQELDLILCATIRGDYITPSQACVIQKEIGASCPAMDISAACTGFIYALDVAAGYFARKKVKKVLVLAGDCMTRMMDWSDRSTCVLFGDGAGAVVLGEGENLMAIQLTANGNVDVLNIPHVGGDSPFDKLPKNQSYLSMNGKEVYKFAVSSMYIGMFRLYVIRLV